MLGVRFLGQFEARYGGNPLTLPTRNAQALFAYLVLNAGKSFRREMLAGLLWPASSEENARSNLRHELWRLRKALPEQGQYCLTANEIMIALNPEYLSFLDVRQLESGLREGNSLDQWIEALSNYGGELLPGFYDEWVVVERERLHALFDTWMDRLLAALQAGSRWTEVHEWAVRWTTFSQWPEPAYRALMIVHALSGDVPKAISTYERFSQGLKKDYGIRPSEQTRTLYRQIKTGSSGALGEMPLDRQPATVSSDSARAATAMTSSSLDPPRSNIPRPLTNFIGREKEIWQVKLLITTARLVTITGSGGVGKTRLAIQVAGELENQFEHGISWVELAPLYEISGFQPQVTAATAPASMDLPDPGTRIPRNTNLVARALVRSLRIPEALGIPDLEKIIRYLRDRQILLVMDNCEHLIEACAFLIEYILENCPQVTILATSREPLVVPGENHWRLPSLSLPDTGPNVDMQSILNSEAVNLFINRAAEARVGFIPSQTDLLVIAQICRHLDGIPLAIELAAVRISLLTVQEIDKRLENRFNLLTGGRRTALPRHQTLWAAIEWSYDLLSGKEQLLLRRLSVFASSFTLEAAEAVCSGDGILPNDVLPLIGLLVDKSLLMVEPAPPHAPDATRYRFLDSICSFGRQKLEDLRETNGMCERHAAYFVNLVEMAEPEIVLKSQGYWYTHLEQEYDNIRAVIDWSIESDRAESALRIVGASLWFWWFHGSTWQGHDLALKSLALPSATKFKGHSARALNTAGYLQWALGDTSSARKSIEEAIAILQATKTDESSLGWAMQMLGLVLASQGEYDRAEEAMKTGMAISYKHNDKNKICFSLTFQGDIHMLKGDLVKAKQIYEENATLLREVKNVVFMAYPVRRLGYLAMRENDLPAAWKFFQQSLELNRESGDQRAMIACLTAVASFALQTGKVLEAAQLYGVVENGLRALSTNLLALDQAEMMRLQDELQGALDTDAYQAAYLQGWKMGEEQAVQLAESIYPT